MWQSLASRAALGCVIVVAIVLLLMVAFLFILVLTLSFDCWHFGAVWF